MRAARSLVSTAALVFGVLDPVMASALMPAGIGPVDARPVSMERVQAVCGPNRCAARPYWRYGYGTGFRPFAGYGPRPTPRFTYQPFGFERFGGGGRYGGGGGFGAGGALGGRR